MSYRAKQATVALNPLALAMVGLLYRMDSADDHIADPKAYSEAKASALTGPKVRHRRHYLTQELKWWVSICQHPPVWYHE